MQEVRPVGLSLSRVVQQPEQVSVVPRVSSVDSASPLPPVERQTSRLVQAQTERAVQPGLLVPSRLLPVSLVRPRQAQAVPLERFRLLVRPVDSPAVPVEQVELVPLSRSRAVLVEQTQKADLA